MALDLTNTEVAFRFLSDARLKKAYLLFRLMQNPKLVKAGTHFLSSALRMHLPIKFAVRKTLFQQFCGGETLAESVKISNELKRAHVKVILDYSVEGEANESGFDHHAQMVIDSIKFAKTHTNVAYAVFKPTALARFELLQKVSEKQTLTAREEKEWQKVRARWQNIFTSALQEGTPVLVDAEESWIQTAVDNLLIEFKKIYNQNSAIIYTTLQMYRKDRLHYFKDLINAAKTNKFHWGVKLVRGAYMEKERLRAEEFGYESPVFADKDGTDRAYDGALKLSLENIASGSIFFGTHNINSVKLACEEMRRAGIENQDTRVYFSQLYGMSDPLTFNLANEGYNVAKLIPYGPLESVLPYLFRRAQENTAIDGQLSRELASLSEEIKRRSHNSHTAAASPEKSSS